MSPRREPPSHDRMLTKAVGSKHRRNETAYLFSWYSSGRAKRHYHANHRIAHPAGSVGVVVRSPVDRSHAYRVKFNDGFEAAVQHDQLVRLAEFKRDSIRRSSDSPVLGLDERIIYRCVIGSRAYGLDDEQSDTDRRGIYLPTAESHWSLFGVPEQLENEETQEAYWSYKNSLHLRSKRTRTCWSVSIVPSSSLQRRWRRNSWLCAKRFFPS